MKTRTLCIVKPDAVMGRHAGEVLTRAEHAGLGIARLDILRMGVGWWKRFYEEHRDKPFFENLTNFMACGPAVFAVLERDDMGGRFDAVLAWREILGAADSRDAATGTVRAAFGDKTGNAIWRNAAHGSDTRIAAEREIDLVWGTGSVWSAQFARRVYERLGVAGELSQVNDERALGLLEAELVVARAKLSRINSLATPPGVSGTGAAGVDPTGRLVVGVDPAVGWAVPEAGAEHQRRPEDWDEVCAKYEAGEIDDNELASRLRAVELSTVVIRLADAMHRRRCRALDVGRVEQACAKYEAGDEVTGAELASGLHQCGLPAAVIRLVDQLHHDAGRAHGLERELTVTTQALCVRATWADAVHAMLGTKTGLDDKAALDKLRALLRDLAAERATTEKLCAELREVRDLRVRLGNDAAQARQAEGAAKRELEAVRKVRKDCEDAIRGLEADVAESRKREQRLESHAIGLEATIESLKASVAGRDEHVKVLQARVLEFEATRPVVEQTVHVSGGLEATIDEFLASEGVRDAPGVQQLASELAELKRVLARRDKERELWRSRCERETRRAVHLDSEVSLLHDELRAVKAEPDERDE